MAGDTWQMTRQVTHGWWHSPMHNMSHTESELFAWQQFEAIQSILMSQVYEKNRIDGSKFSRKECMNAVEKQAHLGAFQFLKNQQLQSIVNIP